MTLAERILALHSALDAAGLPHAIGGAVALAYWTENPRGTSDVDINLFIPATDADRGLKALPAELGITAQTAATVARDGQVRVFWGDTPVDLFFDYAPIHADAALHRRIVPFEGKTIPVLGPVELAVFKAMFDRTQDWADIEAMATAGTLDVDAVREHLEAMLGPGDARLARLGEAERRGQAQAG